MYSARCLLDEDVTLIAVDTESEVSGRPQLFNVVEVGITTLRTRDIANIDPGPDARAWLEHAEHRERRHQPSLFRLS